jgi:hypothetical protein
MTFRPNPLRFVVAAFCVAVASCTPSAGGDPTGPAPSSSGGTAGGSGGREGQASGGAPAVATGTGGSSGSPGSGSGSGGASAGGATGNGTGGTIATNDGGPGDASAPQDAPSSADAPTTGGAFPPGPHKVVLLVGDPNTNDPSRHQLIEILTAMKDSHGVVLEVMDSQKAKAADLMDRALIIAGPNNNYCIDTPEPAFKTLPVPIIVSRDCKTTAFGLGTMMNTQQYLTTPVNISVEKSDHPLAAGLKGVVSVLSTKCRLVRASNLGPDAIKIAKPPADAVPASADSWAIFAYEKGGMMAGGIRAPAKRMGFFWHRPSAVTPEGKKLFQAAVEWSLRP